jgi:16S rRNA processing protein RimM
MEFIRIGKVANTHGIHGHLKIVSESDYRNVYLKKGNTVYFETKREAIPMVVKNSKEHKGNMIVLFENVNNINDVEKYQGAYVSIDAEHLIAPNEDEFYHFELVGLDVFLEDGKHIGKVTKIMETGANDVLYIEGDRDPVLIPFLNQFVPTVDLENEKIIITPIEGMIEDEV